MAVMEHLVLTPAESAGRLLDGCSFLTQLIDGQRVTAAQTLLEQEIFPQLAALADALVAATDGREIELLAACDNARGVGEALDEQLLDLAAIRLRDTQAALHGIIELS